MVKAAILGSQGSDRSVRDSFLYESAQAAVYFALVRTNLGEGGEREVALVQAHDTAAEIDGHDVGVGAR